MRVVSGPSPGRLAFLDGARGIAALAVAVGHTAEGIFPGFYRWSLDWFSPGRAGVCAFFLVSGFVIPLSLERAGGLPDFAISRLTRLYPMYWCSLGLALGLAGLGVEVLPVDFEGELPWSAAANLTMAQEFVGVPHALGLYYTLSIELGWYLACAALFALGWLHATERLLWVALAGLAVVGVGAPVLLDRHTPFSTGFYVVTMLAGTALARHAAGVLPGRRLAALLAGVGAVALVGGWANYVEVPGGDADGALGYSSAVVPWVVAYLAVLAAYAVRERPAAFPGWLAWLGLVSYSVYLLHPLVMSALTEVTTRPWPLLVLTLAATVAVAGLTHRWVEVPGQALGRRWRHRQRLRLAPVTVADP